MNNTNYQSVVKDAVKAKYKRRKSITGRAKQRFPESAEREYVRFCRAYMAAFNHELKASIPEIIKAYNESLRNDSREDSIFGFRDKIRNIFYKIAAKIEKKLYGMKLDKALDKVSSMVHRLSVSEWKRMVKQSIGIDILEDYYSGETYRNAIERWITENVSMISCVPGDSLRKIERIIYDGYTNGMLISDMRDKIQNACNVSQRKATMIARDQVAKLNAELTKMQQRDAGVTRYRWSSSKDSRVRECHRQFEGHVYRWDEPPEDWHRTKDGIVKTGKRYNPGEAVGCRCVAIPIFDIDTLNLPIKGV